MEYINLLRIDAPLIMSNKPRPGGSRDETQNTIDLTCSELMTLLELLSVEYPSKQQPIVLPPYYGDDDSRAE